MEEMNLQVGAVDLHAVRQTQNQDDANKAVPKSDKGVIKDCNYCGRVHEKRKRPAFGQTCRKWAVKIHFVAKYQAKNKVAARQDQDRFYLSSTKIGENIVRETVNLTMLNEVDYTLNGDVNFLWTLGQNVLCYY